MPFHVDTERTKFPNQADCFSSQQQESRTQDKSAGKILTTSKKYSALSKSLSAVWIMPP